MVKSKKIKKKKQVHAGYNRTVKKKTQINPAGNTGRPIKTKVSDTKKNHFWFWQGFILILLKIIQLLPFM